MRFALLATLGAVLALSAAERVVYETDFANLTEVARSPIVEDEYQPPAKWTGLLSLGEEGGVRHLALQVQSAFRPNLGPSLPLLASKVYRIELLARAAGQIEGVHLDVRQRSNPFTWHGATDWPVSQEWAVQTVQIKPSLDDPRAGFYLALRGVGHYLIRSLRVIETDGWVLPTAQGEPRGELLFDGAFRLGGAGWFQTHPDWGDHRQRFIQAGRPSPWVARTTGPGADYAPPAGMFCFISPLTGLHELRYGCSYVVTIEGDVRQDDVALMVLRPSGAKVEVFKKLHVTTANGVATASFDMAPPPHGAMSSQAPHFGLVLEYQAKTTPRVSRVSVREVALGAASGPVPPPAPAVVAEFAGTSADPLGRIGLRGEPLSLRLRAAGLPAGTLTVALSSAAWPQPRLLPVALTAAADGIVSGAIDLADLPSGWYQAMPQVAAPAQACAAVFAIVPRPDPAAAPGFLGAHIVAGDARLMTQAALLGLRAGRAFEFSWSRLEPKLDEWAFPDANLAAYVQAGIEPMVILNGSPHWASSAPDDVLSKAGGWSAYPPRREEHWRAHVARMVAEAKGRVRVWQVWNEPNGYFLKVNKAYHPSVEEAYVGLVRIANEVIKAADPKAIVVAGATAGLAQEFHRRCIALGLLDHCDVISYHAYGECMMGGRGAAAFRPAVQTLRGMMRAAGAVKPVWDCESGQLIGEGLAGRPAAITMLQGLIARQAAGIDRHYVYTASPKGLVSEGNFQMVFGFGSLPLVTAPLLALHDRLIGGASFAADLGDDAAGVHAYAFTRRDGRTVAIGWTSSAEARQAVAGPGGLLALDAFGNRLPAAVDGDKLVLDREPRWFVPAALAEEMHRP